MATHRLGENSVRMGLVGALVVMLAAGGWAMDYPREPAKAAAQYLAARQRVHIIGQIDPDQLATTEALPGGAVVELGGEIMGHTTVLRAERTTFCILLATTSGLTVSLDYPQPIEGLGVGETVQVLATVPQDSGDGRHFDLKGIVRRCDLPPEARLPIPEPPSSQGAPSLVPDGGQGSSPSVPDGEQAPAVGENIPVPADTQAQTDEQQKIAVWANWVAEHNPKLTDTECELIVRWVLDYSALNGVNHLLIFAVIEAESYFDPACVSHAGAVGLMQLMPSTAEHVHVADRWNVRENIRGGIQYLSEQLARYEGRSNYEQCVLALACYNAGPNAVKRYGGVPPYDETRRYIIKVTNRFFELVREGYP